METVITVNPSELNSSLLNKIKKFIGKKNNVGVIIALREFDPDYGEDRGGDSGLIYLEGKEINEVGEDEGDEVKRKFGTRR